MFQDGQTLGDFEILGRLGQGGMGAVYKAQQISLERLVALKTLQGAIASDPEYIARFRREAKAAASLNHPNLVQVYAAGENDGLHWFAMEYVEGESAQARLKRKVRLDPAEAIAIATHIATALEYGWRKAHLIHRDIKPDNIFLSSDGEVKLGDLGLAKSVGVGDTQGLTLTGSSMGTPYYISPEQGQGSKDVDFRADIYSLGCTFYHLACGDPPYPGDTPLAVMMKHVTSPVPNLRDKLPACPQALAVAVLKMMAKNPAHRQQTYAEVIADLRRAYDDLAGASVPDIVAVTQQPQAPPSSPASHDAPTILAADLAAPVAMARAAQPSLQPAPAAASNSKFKLYAALAAVVAILAIVAFFVFGKKEPQLSEAERAEKARAAGGAGAPRTLPSSVSPTGWQPLVSDADWRKTDAAHEFKEGMQHLMRSGIYAQPPSPDGAVRTRIRIREGTKVPSITIRQTIEGGVYKLEVNKEWADVALSYVPPGKNIPASSFTPLGRHKLPKPLQPGDTLDLELHAQGDHLIGKVNGVAVIDAHDAQAKVSGKWGISADDGWYESAEFQPLGAAAAAVSKSPALPVPAAPAKKISANYPQPAKWIDATAEVRAAAVKDGTGVIEGDWLQVTKLNQNKAVVFPLAAGRELRNAAVRVTFYRSAFILMRHSKDESAYTGGAGTNARTNIDRLDPTGTHIGPVRLINGTPIANFDATAEHELVFAVQGDQLTTWLDGTENATGRDSKFTTGALTLTYWPTAADATLWPRIKKVEYAELPEPPLATPVPSPSASYLKSAKWIDATAEVRAAAVKNGTGVIEGDWLQVKNLNKNVAVHFPLAAGRELRNAAVRVTFSRYVVILLRHRKDESAYSGGSGGNGGTSLQRLAAAGSGDRMISLINGTPVPNFDATAAHEFVVAVQGDQLTTWLDGTENATARDPKFPTGALTLTYWPNADPANWPRIKKIEYAELPDTAPQPKPGTGQSTGTPASATKDAPFVNSLGMKFVPVPITGGATDKQRVLFSVWETRVQDYEVFATETKRVWPKPRFEQGPTHPAVDVTWDDAQAFCVWLTERERKAGRIAAGERYRLPADHEWSCAVGIGEREDPAQTPAQKSGKIADVFPWGSAWPPPPGAGNFAGQETRPEVAAAQKVHVQDFIPGYEDGYACTAPVGSFAANRHGLYDLAGNASEWCEDWYDAEQKERVLRDAAWTASYRVHLLSSPRGHPAPDTISGTLGFRCVLAPATSAPPASATAKTASVTPAVAAKQPLDLIALTDPLKDRLKAEGMVGPNTWSKNGSSLRLSTDARSGKICAPVSLNGLRDYEVEIEVAQTQEEVVTLDFPTSPTSQATLDFRVGFGISLARDENRQSQKLSNWPGGVKTPFKAACRLKFDADGENGTLYASVNGLPAGSWHGPLKKLANPPEMHPEFPGQLVPSLFVFKHDRTFTSWTLRVFDGEAKVLRGTGAPASASTPAATAPSKP